MPVIVYKTMTIELFYAQGRRVICEQCQNPFCYIAGGVESAQTTGVPIVSSDEGMRDSALRQAIAGLRKTAKKRNVGEAMCPHCQCYQGWMVSNSLFSNLGCFFLLGVILLGVASAILNAFFEFGGWITVVGWSVVAGAIIGLVIGKFMAITAGPHQGEEDARAMTDDQFREFMAQCDEHDADAFLAWWITMGNEPGEKQAVVSLGMEDQTGQPAYPAEMSTDHVLANV